MGDLRALSFDHHLDYDGYLERALVGNVNINEDARVVSYSMHEDYKVADKDKLHNMLPEIIGKDYFSPDYLVWRNFLYRYLQSHADPEATNTYTLQIIHKDRRFREIHNPTSFAAAAAFKALNTDMTPIFQDVTMSDISKVIENLHMILDDERNLRKQLLDNAVFENVIDALLNSDSPAMHFSAFRVYVLRKRTLGFTDKKLEEKIKPKIEAWSEQMLFSFDELRQIIGEDNKLFEFYSPQVRNIFVRMTQQFVSYLTGDSLFVCRIQEILKDDLASCNSLTDAYVREFISNMPLYEPAIFNPYTLYNLLYYFYKVEDSINDACVLFAVGDRLFKQAIKKMEELYDYLTKNDIGEECISYMKIYLSNAHLHNDEYAAAMNDYLYSLNERGLISNQVLEVRLL